MHDLQRLCTTFVSRMCTFKIIDQVGMEGTNLPVTRRLSKQFSVLNKANKALVAHKNLLWISFAVHILLLVHLLWVKYRSCTNIVDVRAFLIYRSTSTSRRPRAKKKRRKLRRRSNAWACQAAGFGELWF